MKAIIKKESKELSPSEWVAIKNNYQRVYVDLGTGEGEYAFRQSQKMEEILFVGIDACQEMMNDYALKAEKRAKKQHLKNLLYVVANAESLPEELTKCADKITINLPWGSLRDGIVKGCPVLLSNLKRISKSDTIIEIFITYSKEIEATEIESRDLPLLTDIYIKETLGPLYRNSGIEIKKVKTLSNKELIQLDTKWAKKLGYGKPRETFFISCVVK